MPAHIAIIDPGYKHGEIDAFNRLSQRLPLNFSYHWVSQEPYDKTLLTLDLAAERAPIGGVVVFGSGATVSDNEPWQEPLKQRLLHYLDEGIPTLAICYGHQLLGEALGGTLEYVTPDKQKLKGRRKLSLAAHPVLGDAQTGEVVVTHNQCLRVAPPGATVLCHNAEHDFVELFAHGDMPLLAIQAHPEAGQQFIVSNDVPLTPHDPENFRFGTHIIDSFFRYYFGSAF